VLDSLHINIKNPARENLEMTSPLNAAFRQALCLLFLLLALPLSAWAVDTDTVAISAGGSHSCSLTNAGGMKCWGANNNGRLGDGTTTDRPTPVDVVGLSSGVVAISAGGGHNCALTNAGGMKCWGSNSYGQLGDVTTTNRTTPVDVVGLSSGVVAISADMYHSCALTNSGGVKCWGYNLYGRLGDGTTTDRTTPVDVVGLSSGVVAISAGDSHSCALTNSGGMKCWGKNDYGQLGDGTTTIRTTPVDVVGLTSGVAAISANGSHSCALTTVGGVKCWGSNTYGQLGDGTTKTFSTRVPVDVVGLSSGVAAISAGLSHSCALTNAGGMKCWGWNYYGQLGDGTNTLRKTPVDVVGLTSGVAAIAAGWLHSCALTNAGGMKCWGENNNGRLGDGTTTDRPTPVWVVGFYDADNDGWVELADNCPWIANADQINTDGDGQGDACDADDDNDGVPDVSDAFPLNAAESLDTDLDGIGNNADPDDDNDGLPDVMDPLPLQVKFNRDANYKGSQLRDEVAPQ
jgi:alpha-tubulin suppressor-like RCC1 family protein